MRTIGVLSVAMTGFAAAVSMVAAGCFDSANDCEQRLDCTTGTSSSTSSSSSSGDGGNVNCDPAKGAVDASCGVFVSATAAPGGDGTKASPFKTFADAAAAVGVKRVYACAETYNEAATVSFSGGVELYTGFGDCGSDNGWTWQAGSFATLNGAPNVPVLVLDGGANRIENLNVIAAAATVGGGSSIALLVNGGTLDMNNGALTASDAKAGDPGAYTSDDPALDGDAGDPGVAICMSAADNPGPKGKTKTCSTGGSSAAGDGGDGGLVIGGVPAEAGSGTDGTPPDAQQPTKGLGGVGEGQGTPAAVSCESGHDGANGAAGDSGVGATGIGTLSSAGYAGAAGKDGTNGKPGQGGGGGGGAKGALAIDCGSGAANRVGASGGAGGTGGCGGALGGGGKPGGSSIALVSLNATVTLSDVTLSAGAGGDGGKGGDGQSGGQKGTGGAPGAGKGTAQASCQGGYGGTGGPGGPGGGGQGGHSLGIAFKGAAPVGGTFTINPANNGKGGPGGAGNSTADGGKGADGAAAETMEFK